MAIKESKKLEAQELESLLSLRKKNNNLIFQRGQLGLAEDNLQSQKRSFKRRNPKTISRKNKPFLLNFLKSMEKEKLILKMVLLLQ